MPIIFNHDDGLALGFLAGASGLARGMARRRRYDDEQATVDRRRGEDQEFRRNEQFDRNAAASERQRATIEARQQESAYDRLSAESELDALGQIPGVRENPYFEVARARRLGGERLTATDMERLGVLSPGDAAKLGAAETARGQEQAYRDTSANAYRASVGLPNYEPGFVGPPQPGDPVDDANELGLRMGKQNIDDPTIRARMGEETISERNSRQTPEARRAKMALTEARKAITEARAKVKSLLSMGAGDDDPQLIEAEADVEAAKDAYSQLLDVASGMKTGAGGAGGGDGTSIAAAPPGTVLYQAPNGTTRAMTLDTLRVARDQFIQANGRKPTPQELEAAAVTLAEEYFAKIGPLENRGGTYQPRK